MRTLTTAMGNAVAADTVAPGLLCHLALDSGDVRVWSGIGDLSWDSQTWTGLGAVAGVSPVEESTSVSARGIELTLNGIPESMVSLALSEPYRGRACTNRLACFDPDAGTMIADPVQVFGGKIDTMRLDDSGDTSSLTLAVESRFIDFERPRERRYTHEDQQNLYPGDLGLEYVASLQQKEIPWGRKINSGATAAGTGRNPVVRNIR